jgi:hypothetical protein
MKYNWVKQEFVVKAPLEMLSNDDLKELLADVFNVMLTRRLHKEAAEVVKEHIASVTQLVE